MPITPAELDAFRRLRTEDLLLPVLLQLAVLILVSRLVAVLFRRLGQPNVVGEIAAGLMLGPSLFGWLLPDVWQALFRQTGAPLGICLGGVDDVGSGLFATHLNLRRQHQAEPRSRQCKKRHQEK